MIQRCPLGSSLVWNNDGGIPEFCEQNCSEVWQSQKVARLDIFDPDHFENCNPEYGDESLQRTSDSGPERTFSILNTCMEHGEEVFTEEYNFICPNN